VVAKERRDGDVILLVQASGGHAQYRIDRSHASACTSSPLRATPEIEAREPEQRDDQGANEHSDTHRGAGSAAGNRLRVPLNIDQSWHLDASRRVLEAESSSTRGPGELEG